MKIVYVAAYLSSKYDAHRDRQIEQDDYSYIENYCISIKVNGLNSIIIVDQASDDFIDQHQSRKDDAFSIEFWKAEPLTFQSGDFNKHIHPHDERFYHYLRVIQSTEADYFVLTDISDVEIMNPIEDIIDLAPDTLFVGKEGETILVNDWFAEYMKDMNWMGKENSGLWNKQWVSSIFFQKTLLNCGTMAGHRDILIDFLQNVTRVMTFYYREHQVPRPIDMFCVNYSAYYKFYDKLYQGNDLTTQFGCEDYDRTKAIKHK